MGELKDGFVVAGWHVSPVLGRVSLGENVVQLEPKVMHTLVMLARHAGQPVSRETLLKAVWSDVSVVDNVLSRAISRLRSVFNDDPRRPRVIETIPKFGYRLVAEIETCQAPVVTTGQSQSRRGTAAAVVLLMIALVCFLYMFFPKHIGPIHFHRADLTR